MRGRADRPEDRHFLENLQLSVHRRWALHAVSVGCAAGLVVGVAQFGSDSAFVVSATILGAASAGVWSRYPNLFWGGALLLLYSTFNTSYGPAMLSLVLLATVLTGLQYMFRAPLHSATRRNDSEKVKRLVASGADVNELFEGVAPLHVAAETGNQDLVKCLLNEGANIEGRSRDGSTPLLSAAIEGHRDVVEILIRKDAKPDVETTGGRTALHMAAYGGHTELANFLLSIGLRNEKTTPSGHTAAALASRQGHRELSDMLRAFSFERRTEFDDESRDSGSAIQRSHEIVAEPNPPVDGDDDATADR